MDGKSLPCSYTYFGEERRQWFYVKDSENELFDKAEKVIHSIAEAFSKAQVSILENAEKQLCLPPVEKGIVKNIIDTVHSKVLQEYEMKIMPNKDFLHDTGTLAARITKTILAETFDFQIHPNLIQKLPFKSHSKLSTNVLIKRVQCDITKSRYQRQASSTYTMLTHTHFKTIVTKIYKIYLSCVPWPPVQNTQITSQSDNTVMKLMNEIMSVISTHAI